MQKNKGLEHFLILNRFGFTNKCCWSSLMTLTLAISSLLSYLCKEFELNIVYVFLVRIPVKYRFHSYFS